MTTNNPPPAKVRSNGSRFVKSNCKRRMDLPPHQTAGGAIRELERMIPEIALALPEPVRDIVGGWLTNNPKYTIKVLNLIKLTNNFAPPHVMLHAPVGEDPRRRLYCLSCRLTPLKCLCDSIKYNRDPADRAPTIRLKLRFGDHAAPTSPRIRTGLPIATNERYKAAVRFWLKRAPQFTTTGDNDPAHINRWVAEHTPLLAAYASTWYAALPKILDFTTDKHNRHTPPALWLDPWCPAQDPVLIQETLSVHTRGLAMTPDQLACYTAFIDRVTKYIDKTAHAASRDTLIAFVKQKPQYLDGIIGLLEFTNGLEPILAHVTDKGGCRVTKPYDWTGVTKRYSGFAKIYIDTWFHLLLHLDEATENAKSTNKYTICAEFSQKMLSMWPITLNRILHKGK